MAYRKVGKKDAMYTMIQHHKKNGHWICDAITHNSRDGCKNPQCFKYERKRSRSTW